MNKKKGILLLINVIMLIFLTGLDQFAKYLAVTRLKGKSDYIIWEHVFELHYLENRGAAFGMLKNQKYFFVFIAIVILALIAYVLIKFPTKKRFLPLNLLLVVIAAGAVGNMIDRIRLDYVVDFFYFSLIHFPVFNVADIYVTVATAILIIMILFYYKEDDFACLKLQISKNNEVE
jgi:signal peptidase II